MENRLFFASHVCLCNIYPLCAFVITLYFPSEEERKHKGETVRDYRRLSTQNNHKAHNLSLSHIHKNTTSSKKKKKKIFDINTYGGVQKLEPSIINVGFKI